MSRRRALQGVGGMGLATWMGTRASAGAATLVQATPTTDISGTELSILQWAHFVPAFDTWLDTFIAEWEEATGVSVTLDRINTADIPATFAAEISAGSGHDIVEHIASLPQYEESVMDMTDLVAEAESRHGPTRNDRGQLLQPHHREVLRVCPRIRARPVQLPQKPLGDGRSSGWPVHIR